VLDFGLHHANSAVVMATAKLFLHYTMSFTSQHQQVGLWLGVGAVALLRGAGCLARPLRLLAGAAALDAHAAAHAA
jgi:hypothetical protein